MRANPADDPIQNVTGIIYGDSGGGKTKEAAELAQAIRRLYGGKILYIDAVNAWRTLKNHRELLEGLVHLKYTGKSMLDVLNAGLEAKAAQVADFKVIVLDEMSAMTDMDGDLVLATRAANDKDKDPDVLTQPDMGATTERMRRTIVKLLKQDVSVIFVSHQRQDEDKQVGYKTTRPRFMPKFSGTIREGLDFVVHMVGTQEARDGSVRYVRTIQCHPTKTVVAKTRVGGLALKVSPDEFVEGVIKWMKGEVGDSTVDVIVNDLAVDAGSSDEPSFDSFVVE